MSETKDRVAELEAKVADANRCAAQALQDRDMLRNQWFDMERQARDLAASSPLARSLREELNTAREQLRISIIERNNAKIEVKLLKARIRLLKAK